MLTKIFERNKNRYVKVKLLAFFYQKNKKSFIPLHKFFIFTAKNIL